MSRGNDAGRIRAENQSIVLRECTGEKIFSGLSERLFARTDVKNLAQIVNQPTRIPASFTNSSALQCTFILSIWPRFFSVIADASPNDHPHWQLFVAGLPHSRF